MRVVIAHPGPSFSVSDVFEGWKEALGNAGLDVYTFNLDDRLAFYDSVYKEHAPGVMKKALGPEDAMKLALNGLPAMLFKLHPHILLSVSAFFVDTDMLDQARRYGTKVVVLHTESPYEDGRQLELAQHADLNLINDPTNLERFREVAPTEYVPHAYRPSIHYPGTLPERLKNGTPIDFVFVGTGFPSRIEFFEAMDLDGIQVALGGNWGGLSKDSPLHKFLLHDQRTCLPNTETAGYYRASRVGINFYRREAEEAWKGTGWACGPREIEMAACGLFFLRDSRPESDELFPMLPTFDGPENASEQLRWWLAHEKQREDAAFTARVAIAERTFDNNVSTTLRALGL
jgi:spore maturation protein CgeB